MPAFASSISLVLLAGPRTNYIEQTPARVTRREVVADRHKKPVTILRTYYAGVCKCAWPHHRLIRARRARLAKLRRKELCLVAILAQVALEVADPALVLLVQGRAVAQQLLPPPVPSEEPRGTFCCRRTGSSSRSRPHLLGTGRTATSTRSHPSSLLTGRQCASVGTEQATIARPPWQG